MIYISKFDSDYAGRTFKDERGTVYTCIGYGDNQGNPYLVGLTQTQTGAIMRTTLMKNVEFIPTPAAT